MSVFIRPFEKRSYYVIPLGVRPSVCKLPCNSSYCLRPIELKLGIRYSHEVIQRILSRGYGPTIFSGVTAL